MPLPFRPWSITGIGSLPHGSPAEAVAFMRRTSDIPYLPQLPRVTPEEFMLTQTQHTSPRGEVPYVCASLFAPGDGVLKIQVAGPVTLRRQGLTPPSYGAVAAWFRKAYAVRLPIVQIDEPMLEGKAWAEQEKLNDTIRSIEAEGCLAMLHCCADKPPAAFWQARPAILSFDASLVSPERAITRELGLFLSAGGWIAWGIVPTSGDGKVADMQTVVRHWLARLGDAAPLARRQSLLTPACGLGLRNESLADRVFAACRELSQSLASA